MGELQTVIPRHRMHMQRPRSIASPLRPSVATVLVALILPCCTNEKLQPRGSYTLDPETTLGFTKTRLVMKEGLAPDAATPVAHQLVDGATGTLEIDSEGTVSVRLTLGPEDERELVGSWQLRDREFICTDAEDADKTWTWNYVEGSDALHQVVQIGDHRAELVFLAEPR